MNKHLIFLESFTKRKTIKNFLPNNYEIFATGGHLTEIEKSGFYNLGVDLVKFVPQYRLLPEKIKNVKYWQNYLKNNQPGLILLATDPDREGEAIAQEVIKILNLQSHQYKRLLFYEITQQSIQQALKDLLPLNQKLVESQSARQVLDRMIGFCLSPLLQKKLSALSAGRVQSVVLKMIVDREIAIQEYEKKKEYILQGIYEVKRLDNKIEKYTLRQKDPQGKLVVYSDQTEAEKVKSELGPIFSLINEEIEERFIFAKNPLTTSLLLYEARSQLSFSIAQTTRLVQQLYEGIWLENKKKQVGLVTYPRTDSHRLNKNFIQQAYANIQNK